MMMGNIDVVTILSNVFRMLMTNNVWRQRQESQANDTYETEIARLARVSPDMVGFREKSGLDKDDMQASLAELKALREKARTNIQLTKYCISCACEKTRLVCTSRCCSKDRRTLTNIDFDSK